MTLRETLHLNPHRHRTLVLVAGHRASSSSGFPDYGRGGLRKVVASRHQLGARRRLAAARPHLASHVVKPRRRRWRSCPMGRTDAHGRRLAREVTEAHMSASWERDARARLGEVQPGDQRHLPAAVYDSRSRRAGWVWATVVTRSGQVDPATVRPGTQTTIGFESHKVTLWTMGYGQRSDRTGHADGPGPPPDALHRQGGRAGWLHRRCRRAPRRPAGREPTGQSDGTDAGRDPVPSSTSGRDADPRRRGFPPRGQTRAHRSRATGRAHPGGGAGRGWPASHRLHHDLGI